MTSSCTDLGGLITSKEGEKEIEEIQNKKIQVEKSNKILVLNTNSKEKKKKKKICNEQSWTRNILKKQRNEGKSYISPKKGKLIPAKKIGKPCSCGCFEKVLIYLVIITSF